MNNVKCRKLIIDRQKAPKSTTTFAGISTFASFTYPSSGQYEGGIEAQSLVGVGKTKSVKKNSRTPVAGNTGSKTEEQAVPTEVPAAELEGGPHSAYALQFIQHVSAPASAVQIKECPEAYNRYDRPKKGFGLKTTSGVRTVFTARQKEVMIEFFNKQHTTNIRSNPQEVNEAFLLVVKRHWQRHRLRAFGAHIVKKESDWWKVWSAKSMRTLLNSDCAWFTGPRLYVGWLSYVFQQQSYNQIYPP